MTRLDSAGRSVGPSRPHAAALSTGPAVAAGEEGDDDAAERHDAVDDGCDYPADPADHRHDGASDGAKGVRDLIGDIGQLNVHSSNFIPHWRTRIPMTP